MVSCGGAYPMVFNNGDKKIALDFRNEITVNKFDDLNM